jgi:hypothetical protein
VIRLAVLELTGTIHVDRDLPGARQLQRQLDAAAAGTPWGPPGERAAPAAPDAAAPGEPLPGAKP